MSIFSENILKCNTIHELNNYFYSFEKSQTFSNGLKNKNAEHYKHIQNLIKNHFGYESTNYNKVFYDLNHPNKHYCKICSNEISIFSKQKNGDWGYNNFCSKSCMYKDPNRYTEEVISKQTENRNKTMQKLLADETWAKEYKSKISKKSKEYYNDPENRKKQSDVMKEKIKNGDFTPCIRNSLTQKTLEYKGFKFRSRYEIIFFMYHYDFLKNKNIEYETLRIPYTYKNSEHTYIVDFIDRENNIVYEIKPKDLKLKDKNLEKELALINWAQNNQYTYYSITEDQLNLYYNNMKIENFEIDLLNEFKDRYKWITN
jgi:hypothetical protein